MKLAVLNPGGNDAEQHFRDGAGAPDDAVHAPVNYHAYAACTGGGFFRDPARIAPEQKEVLLVLRRNLNACATALNKLLSAGQTVAVSIKESGSHQVAELLRRTENVRLFEEICAKAHGAISSTPDLVALYRAAGAKGVEFIPTPYPVDDERWHFSAPPVPRRGVFIGTREFDVPSRHHAVALLLARELREPITVVNTNGRAGRKQLSALAPQATVVEGPMPYSKYLRLIAQHRLVFQLDRGAVPGQVAGDALLARVLCVGGDGAVERVAFADSSGHGRDGAELLKIAATMLADDAAGERAVAASQHAASASLSFAAGAARLTQFFARIGAA